MNIENEEEEFNEFMCKDQDISRIKVKNIINILEAREYSFKVWYDVILRIFKKRRSFIFILIKINRIPTTTLWNITNLSSIQSQGKTRALSLVVYTDTRGIKDKVFGTSWIIVKLVLGGYLLPNKNILRQKYKFQLTPILLDVISVYDDGMVWCGSCSCILL